MELHLVDSESRTVDQFLTFVDSFLHQEAELDLPRITGQELLDAARAKKSTAGGLDVWVWNEVKAPSSLVLWVGYLFEHDRVRRGVASRFAGCPYCYESEG